jgi:hypothetical protein
MAAGFIAFQAEVMHDDIEVVFARGSAGMRAAFVAF